MNNEEMSTLFQTGNGRRGMNALHYAAYCGDQEELVRQLDAGVGPDIKDEYRGCTAFHWLADMAATEGPRVQMLQLLVEHGADIHLRADNGATALSLTNAAGSTMEEQIAKELVRLGVVE